MISQTLINTQAVVVVTKATEEVMTGGEDGRGRIGANLAPNRTAAWCLFVLWSQQFCLFACPTQPAFQSIEFHKLYQQEIIPD
jgi:hypothetical protein